MSKQFVIYKVPTVLNNSFMELLDIAQFHNNHSNNTDEEKAVIQMICKWLGDKASKSKQDFVAHRHSNPEGQRILDANRIGVAVPILTEEELKKDSRYSDWQPYGEEHED